MTLTGVVRGRIPLEDADPPFCRNSDSDISKYSLYLPSLHIELT